MEGLPHGGLFERTPKGVNPAVFPMGIPVGQDRCLTKGPFSLTLSSTKYYLLPISNTFLA